MTNQQQLIERALEGDHAAWHELLDPLHLPVAGYLSRFVQAADAQDIAQNTWIQVINKLDQFEGKSSLRSWVFRIAYRQMLNHQNKKRAGSSSELEPESSNPSAEQVMMSNETSDEVLQCIDRLPAAQRQVVWLRFCEKLTFREISEITDTPLNTVLSRMHQAKQSMQKSLAHTLDSLGAVQ